MINVEGQTDNRILLSKPSFVLCRPIAILFCRLSSTDEFLLHLGILKVYTWSTAGGSFLSSDDIARGRVTTIISPSESRCRKGVGKCLLPCDRDCVCSAANSPSRNSERTHGTNGWTQSRHYWHVQDWLWSSPRGSTCLACNIVVNIIWSKDAKEEEGVGR